MGPKPTRQNVDGREGDDVRIGHAERGGEGAGEKAVHEA